LRIVPHLPSPHRNAGRSGHCRLAPPSALTSISPPIPGHQIGSGRAGGRPLTFPQPRAAADSPESGHPLRQLAQGLNCESPNLPRGLHGKQEPTCKKIETSRGPGAKCNFNSTQVLLKLVKSLENSRKIRNMQAQFS
jgi:hypothetical protein